LAPSANGPLRRLVSERQKCSKRRARTHFRGFAAHSLPRPSLCALCARDRPHHIDGLIWCGVRSERTPSDGRPRGSVTDSSDSRPPPRRSPARSRSRRQGRALPPRRPRRQGWRSPRRNLRPRCADKLLDGWPRIYDATVATTSVLHEDELSAQPR
jgi:hypothetical protein